MKVAGFDLGTNSIGIAVRDTEKSDELTEQLDYFSVVTFPCGVGTGKTGEFSYAAERTQKRSQRKLYKVRRYRKWSTLALLIQYDFCPLSLEELDRWRVYDKERGLKRQYPVESETFARWIRLDFDGDGMPDCTPYQLRKSLVETKLDLSLPSDRYKVGRALYHIAQRRGFKSSRGETAKEQESAEQADNSNEAVSLQKSEEKKSKLLTDFMKAHDCPTVGYALALLIEQGIRVRGSEYQAVRSQYMEEVETIFRFQGMYERFPEFCQGILSRKKGEGTIFYKRPLRSQRGLVGKCTLEPNKPRCPIAHPDFEEFRALVFLNNIKYRQSAEDPWLTLGSDMKEELMASKFYRCQTTFLFKEIREWLEKKTGWSLSKKGKTVNYSDRDSVSASPVTARLRHLLGDDWKNWTFVSEFEKCGHDKVARKAVYTAYDIWHVCYDCDDEDFLSDFAANKLSFDSQQTKKLVRLYEEMRQGYAMLSLKAIRNILPFLRKGYIYSTAVMLAKIPEIVGREKWNVYEKDFVAQVHLLQQRVSDERLVLNIVNTLIANYKSNDYEERWAEHNYNYVLDDSDRADVLKAAVGCIGQKTWESKPKAERDELLKKVEERYQAFFADHKRKYYEMPKMKDVLKAELVGVFSDIEAKSFDRLYHPSDLEVYPHSATGLLGSPVTGALKNPMAMRVLYSLRREVNALLKKGIIDADTRIVIETARELNDANMRAAVADYQKKREKENQKIREILVELLGKRDYSDTEVDKTRFLLEQHDILDVAAMSQAEKKTKKNTEKQKAEKFDRDTTKYRLWLEQGCRCIYTGKVINITSLFNDNLYEIEHTIPRSLSFDNSQANLTVCDAHFNRHVKKNRIPTQLDNYDEIYMRITPWVEKVERLADRVKAWTDAAKRAQDKDRKDYCIRQRHQWQMELDYWRDKVNRFTMTEVTDGFRNSQLVDTRIITKYAYHFLKTVFERVDVQKGAVTADFRKMLGVQSLEEKKNRDRHSHHAIDATVLTLVPAANVRDRLLQLFYEKEEAERFSGNAGLKERAFLSELKRLNFRGVSRLPGFVDEKILINHTVRDRTLVPASRKLRRRGKEVLFDGKNRRMTGDSIRGQLHGDTFYGAIRQYCFDDDHRVIRDADGKPCETDVMYVVRKEFRAKGNSGDAGGFALWADVEKSIVDKALYRMMRSQFADDVSFKDAYAQGIYMLDRAGRRVNKIRHIRCWASRVNNPLVVRKHTHLSDREYKQNYYAVNGENTYLAIYWDGVSNNNDFDCKSLMDLARMKPTDRNPLHFFPPQKKVGKGKKAVFMPLYAVLKPGTRVLVFNPDEFGNKQRLTIDGYKHIIQHLDRSQLMRRLYHMVGFDSGDDRIQFKYHLEARNDNRLMEAFPENKYGKVGKIGFSYFDLELEQPKLRLSRSNYYFLIEGKDFEIDGDSIVFK